MATQRFTPEILPQLREWFEYNFDAGCTLSQLKGTLTASGYLEDEIDLFIESQRLRLAQRAGVDQFDTMPTQSKKEAVGRFWRRTDVLNSFTNITIGDRVAKIMARNASCAIYYIDGFLSDEECESLINAARAKLLRSTIVDATKPGDVVSPTRSSRGAVLHRGSTPTVKRIESRIAKLTDLPISHGEGLQILNYDLGGEYYPHFDYFDPKTEGGRKVLSEGSQRLATVIMYLSDVENGGDTKFPELSLEFSPARGAALLFASIGRDGALLQSSLHAGCPVTSGEKWIATKWLRLSPYEKHG